jgi:hypothetical protein
MHAFARTALLAAVLAVSAAAPAAAQPWRDALQARVDSAFTRTKLSSDLMRITEPGTTLVLQKDGIPAKPGSDGMLVETHYRDGQVVQPRGFMAFMTGSNSMRQLKTGDRMYLTSSRVRGEGVVLWLVTDEISPITVEGNTRQTRYSTALVVDFPRGYLATADADSVLAKLAEVVRTQEAVSAPATISLGNTPAQVEAALGKPTTVINLGAKVIFVYPSMRVVFEDGKVADVQ